MASLVCINISAGNVHTVLSYFQLELQENTFEYMVCIVVVISFSPLEAQAEIITFLSDFYLLHCIILKHELYRCANNYITVHDCIFGLNYWTLLVRDSVWNNDRFANPSCNMPCEIPKEKKTCSWYTKLHLPTRFYFRYHYYRLLSMNVKSSII